MVVIAPFFVSRTFDAGRLVYDLIEVTATGSRRTGWYGRKARGLTYQVMVGGAPVTADFAQEIGAAGHCDDVGSLVSETERVFSALGYRAI